MDPFLRWAGGKQWLAKRISGLIPKNAQTYYEAFLGGGSLFFVSQPRQAILGDINKPLIDCYQVLRDSPNDLIAILSRWKNDEETYYKIRAKEYKKIVWRSAQFIYLNKTCWNGLFRVNQHGKYNVPFGYNNRKVYDEAHLIEISITLQVAQIACCDFQTLLEPASPGDFIYLDPPYTVLHSRNGFRNYNEKLFNWQDQIRLASTAQELVKRGCFVVVSNANVSEVINLYPDFICQTISRFSILAADPKYRRKTDEALLISSNLLLR